MSSVKMCHYCEDDQDCQFELELSLQNIRRSLIQMLDDFEAQYCIRCRILKCSCDQVGLTPPRSSTSGSVYDFRVIARPVAHHQLTRDGGQRSRANPHPTRLNAQETRTDRTEQTINDIESWVRTSTPDPKKTESPGCKPIGHIDQLSSPVPKSIWNDYKETEPEVNTSSVSLAGNVEEFFRSFSARMYVSGNMAYEQNRVLMQQLKAMVKTQKESEDSSSRPD